MKKVTVAYNHWLPKMFGYVGITLYPYIFISLSEEQAKEQRIINHEWVHVVQVRKLGWFRFYGTYLLYYLAGLLKYGNPQTAYYNIPFECEAYEEQATFELPNPLE